MTEPVQKFPGRIIGWNSLILRIPENWEVRVSAPKHIVLEHDFTPCIQLKWETAEKSASLKKLLGNPPNSSGFHKKIKNLDQWFQIEERFEIHPLATQTRNDYQAILIDRDSGTVCHVQILASQLEKVEQYLDILATLAFHPTAPESIWTLQDATFSIPAEATLEDYGFKAGLSWARFRKGPNSIQLARLAPADQRLSQASPDNILEQLSGARDLQNEPSRSLHDTELSRKPSLLSQVGYRLKRQHPFIQAALRHLTGKNILAGCIISSRQPIPIDTAIQLLPQE